MPDTMSTTITAAGPLISSLIDVFIRPKLNELAQHWRRDRNLIEASFVDGFHDYLKRSHERLSIMNTIVFRNQPKQLNSLYVPLTIKSTSTGELHKITGFSNELVPTYRKIVITDSAGMGKSTLLKFLFLSCIDSGTAVPVFIELRKLTSKNTLLDEIFNQLNSINNEIEKSFVLDLIERGDFIFFLDGFDEIAFSEKSEVIRNLQDFIGKASKNMFVLSSRPESAIASFVDFLEFTISPLSKPEAYTLLRKYDSNGQISEALITRLEMSTSNESLQDFLENPLMVSLLYKGFEYKETIPLKKAIFYRQVYDALFEGHDLMKGSGFVHQKNSGLDIEDFHTLLRALGYITVKTGTIEYDKDRFVKYIREAKKLCAFPQVRESQFLHDLISSVPLFSSEGNYYRWNHKAIQEYFAAQYICVDTKGDQETVLMNIYHSDKMTQYIHLLELCYDIDYKTFRNTILRTLLEEIIGYYESSFLHDTFKQIDTNILKMRRELTFDTVVLCIHFEDFDHKIINIFEDLDLIYKIIPDLPRDSLSHLHADHLALGKDYLTLKFTSDKVGLMLMLEEKKESFLHKHTTDEKLKVQFSDFKGYLASWDLPMNSTSTKQEFQFMNEFLQNFDGISFLIDNCRKELNEIYKHYKLKSLPGLLDF